MRAFPFGMALLLAASLLPLQAEAATKKSQHKKSPVKAVAVVAPAPVAAPVQAPADFADAFHEAMRSRNRAQILSMLAPDLVVFENGYIEKTREEYVNSNLSDDAEFASAMDYRPLSRGVIGSGDSMTVLTKASIQGIFGDQRVDLVQSETMILRRTPTAWEIVHLHWSAHPRQPGDSAPPAQVTPPAPQVEPAPPAQVLPPVSPPESPPVESEPQAQPVPPAPQIESAPEVPAGEAAAPQVEAAPEPQAPVAEPHVGPEPPAALRESTELTAPAVPEAKPEELKTP